MDRESLRILWKMVLLEDFRKTGCERIIAIGGGAVIDMAKILVLEGNASAADIYQRKAPLKKIHRLVAVPTTCGAGSASPTYRSWK